jgi:hypothetical protein
MVKSSHNKTFYVQDQSSHGHTRKLLEPYMNLAEFEQYWIFSRLTSVSCFADEVLDSALVRDAHLLFLDGATPVVKALGLVHGFLERIALPSKHVVGVRAVAPCMISRGFKIVRKCTRTSRCLRSSIRRD